MTINIFTIIYLIITIPIIIGIGGWIYVFAMIIKEEIDYHRALKKCNKKNKK